MTVMQKLVPLFLPFLLTKSLNFNGELRDRKIKASERSKDKEIIQETLGPSTDCERNSFSSLLIKGSLRMKKLSA